MQFRMLRRLFLKKMIFLKGQTKNLHRQILNGIDGENASVYRNVQVFISDAQHTPPKPLKIQEEIDELMCWYVHC